VVLVERCRDLVWGGVSLAASMVGRMTEARKVELSRRSQSQDCDGPGITRRAAGRRLQGREQDWERACTKAAHGAIVGLAVVRKRKPSTNCATPKTRRCRGIGQGIAAARRAGIQECSKRRCLEGWEVKVCDNAGGDAACNGFVNGATDGTRWDGAE
jgi:hypothetical protein